MNLKSPIVEDGLHQFPELKNVFANYIRHNWNGEFPGAYNVYREVFRPLFAKALEENNVELLRRFSQFFKNVFDSGDTESANVLWLTLLRWLLSRDGEFMSIWEFCGPNTRTLVRSWSAKLNLSFSTRAKLYLC